MPLDEIGDMNEFDNAEEETCEACKGTGMIDCPLEYGTPDHPEECPACGGSGKALCPECTGAWL